MSALLQALSRRVSRFEIIDSVQLLSNALNGLQTLNVRVS
jgi:hypothetical protein